MLQEAPKTAQEACETPKQRLKTSKMTPRQHKNPQDNPKGLQDAPRAFQEASEEDPKRPKSLIFNGFLMFFCVLAFSAYGRFKTA